MSPTMAACVGGKVTKRSAAAFAVVAISSCEGPCRRARSVASIAVYMASGWS